jgi:hypothetical protein
MGLFAPYRANLTGTGSVLQIHSEFVVEDEMISPRVKVVVDVHDTDDD